jgi:acyl-CoA synthetase (AMP-forming)/AMP-acid ligase II
MGLRNYTVYSAIKRSALLYGEKIALLSDKQTIRYHEFLAKVDRLACGLLKTGLERGDRVAVLAQNCLEYVYLYGAAAKVGAIMVPINWRLKDAEIEYILSDSDPKFVFVGQDFEDLITRILARAGCKQSYYSMENVSEKFHSIAALLKNDGICSEIETNSDDEYVIIYTAAIQGRPRGAAISHRNILLFNMQSMYCWTLTPEDTHILLMPLYHNFGLTFTLMLVHAGGLNIIIPKFDVDVALKYIHEGRVTIFGGFPPMLDSLLERAQAVKADLSSLRVVVGIDPPETVRKLQALSKAVYWTGYAQTETTGFIALAPYFDKPGSAGLPGLVTEIQIMDEFGRIVEKGKVGEIVVRGPMVFKGYRNLERDNENVFRYGWHHTGDIGRLDEGRLWYMGRTPSKELIKSGGENVYPAEVERVILEHPLVREVVVIGIPDLQWGEVIKAVCVLKEEETLTEEELIQFVGDRIARYKRPKRIVFVLGLPKREDGLVDREKIKAIHRET